MLILKSNGYGYNRLHNWLVMGLTDNALEVMTKMGNFTYYRLQPEIIKIGFGKEWDCTEDDNILFADGTTVCVDENKLYGIAIGTSYILKQNTASKMIFAYKVIVE